MKWYFLSLGRKRLIEFIVFLVFIFFFLGPLLQLLALSFSGQWDYPSIVPQTLSLQWWSFVFSQDDIVESIVLSFTIAIIVTLVSIIVCIPAAYAFARIQFPLRKMFLFSFMLTNAFPKMGLYVSIAVLFYKLGLMNSMTGIVLIHVVNTLMFMTWIPAAAFKSVHASQEEAARDAGAGPFRVFWHVTLPMAMPGIAVASIFTFLNSLDEAQGTFLVGLPSYKTMPLIMYSVVTDYPSTAGAVFSVILTLPTIILLFFARRYINADVISGGVQMK